MPKHGDDDGDGIVNVADPDWLNAPDRWVGVTRNPDNLPIAPPNDAEPIDISPGAFIEWVDRNG